MTWAWCAGLLVVAALTLGCGPRTPTTVAAATAVPVPPPPPTHTPVMPTVTPQRLPTPHLATAPPAALFFCLDGTEGDYPVALFDLAVKRMAAEIDAMTVPGFRGADVTLQLMTENTALTLPFAFTMPPIPHRPSEPTPHPRPTDLPHAQRTPTQTPQDTPTSYPTRCVPGDPKCSIADPAATRQAWSDARTATATAQSWHSDRAYATAVAAIEAANQAARAEVDQLNQGAREALDAARKRDDAVRADAVVRAGRAAEWLAQQRRAPTTLDVHGCVWKASEFFAGRPDAQPKYLVFASTIYHSAAPKDANRAPPNLKGVDVLGIYFICGKPTGVEDPIKHCGKHFETFDAELRSYGAISSGRLIGDITEQTRPLFKWQ